MKVRMTATAGARSRFFLYMALGFMAIALVGFSTTFFIPVARGAFSAPPVIHVHGVLLFAWLILFVLQSSLIQRRRILVHRRLGVAGVVMSAGIVISGVLVGVYATRRDLAAGGDEFVRGQLVNILIEMLLFGALVTAAILYRRDGESHKRLLLLATISALAPAWLRLRLLFPAVPNPFVTFSLLAASLLLLAIARDWISTRAVHPVYVWAGSIMVGVHIIELLAIRSDPWLRLSRWLLRDAIVH